MPEVRYDALPKVLEEIKNGITAPLYLLYGDEFLYKSAFKGLLDALVPTNKQSINYEALDGTTVSIHEVIERLKTFPLFPGEKVVAVHGTKVFYSTATVDELVHKSKEAFEENHLKASARYFMHVLHVVGLSLEDVRGGDQEGLLEKTLIDRFQVAKQRCGKWLSQVIDYCLQAQMSVPAHEDDAEVLSKVIVSGFPDTNHLILTTELVDKRRKLYTAMKTTGVVVDCSIPKGDRTADKRQQKEVLQAHQREALKSAGKTMAPGGFEALYEKTGGGLRNFTNQLEKLITFVGGRKEILVDDIEKVVQRTKEDPIYELSNAIGERDLQKALFFVDSLLKANFFPLQTLSAGVNQVRKLFLASDEIRRKYGDTWRRDMSFQAFKKTILPALQKDKPSFLASNAHPYMIYRLLINANNYTIDELAGALETFLDAEMRLKTSRQPAKLILEQAILRICGNPKRSIERT